MKVLAVIVGEEDMPDSCWQCDYRNAWAESWCDIIQSDLTTDEVSFEQAMEIRHPNCPLKTAAQYAEEVKGE
jgi:hypothetical protein